MKNSLNFIDLFCGAGGFSCGLEMENFECVLGVDFDKYAIETFKQNHKSAESFCGDISKLSNKQISLLLKGKKVDLVVGGPPCQGFSTVGKGDPKDKRNKLFLEYLRVVEHTKPQFIVIENVTGLLAKKNEKTMVEIIKKFNKLGYVIDFKVLSAIDYGVPENRKRTIIIGSKNSDFILFPNKTHGKEKIDINGKKLKSISTVNDAFKSLAYRGKLHNHDIDLASIKSKLDLRRIKRIPEGKGIRYQQDEEMYLTPSLKFDVDWTTLPEGRFRQTKLQRLDGAKPSPTIMTHRHNYFHPTEDRYLTQREAAKLQSFPNKFIFSGPVSAQWRQIGNAVPPLLGRAIGKSILMMQEYLNANKKKKAKLSSTLSKEANQNIETARKKAFQYAN